MKKEEIEYKKLVDELVFWSERYADLWKYHPENPDSRDIIEDSLEMLELIKELEESLKKF